MTTESVAEMSDVSSPIVISLHVSDIVFRKDLYPRFEPNMATIEAYSESLDVLPPIEVNQHHILIDGFHRWKAHETKKAGLIRAVITETESEQKLFALSVERNATHGLQLAPNDKKKLANRWFGDIEPKEICRILSISEKTFRRWTEAKQQQVEAELSALILDLHMRCYSQTEIAERVNLPARTVSDKIAEIGENGQMSKSANFGNFSDFESDEDSARKIYTIWNFAKATNEVKHFGNIPPEIIDNLLYLYTSPFDVVFDPFGGGGSTLDMCRKRLRRCYISDLTPKPGMEDKIRPWDISEGLPKDLPTPKLVFLDPPYWQQAKEKYSEKDTDLGNVDLEKFLDVISEVAKQSKRKWSKNNASGKLAIIIGPWKENGEKIDLALLCYERISKYLPIKERIIVPYNTQVHGGAYVNLAKEKKELLYLHRDLMVFGE